MARPKKNVAVDERVELFLDLLALLPTSHGELNYLSEESGVSIGTLYNWIYGETMKPRIDTLHKVAVALGYRITLVRSKGHGKLKVVK